MEGLDCGTVKKESITWVHRARHNWCWDWGCGKSRRPWTFSGYRVPWCDDLKKCSLLRHLLDRKSLFWTGAGNEHIISVNIGCGDTTKNRWNVWAVFLRLERHLHNIKQSKWSCDSGISVWATRIWWEDSGPLQGCWEVVYVGYRVAIWNSTLVSQEILSLGNNFLVRIVAPIKLSDRINSVVCRKYCRACSGTPRWIWSRRSGKNSYWN